MEPQNGNSEERHNKVKAVTSVKFFPVSDNNINSTTDGPNPTTAEVADMDTEIARTLEQYESIKDYTTPRAALHTGPSNYQVQSLSDEGQREWAGERLPISRIYTGRHSRYPDAIRQFKETIRSCESPNDTPHKPEKMQRRDMDYTPVFMRHAQLYVAGTQNAIENLRQLALHRLCRTLRIWVDWYEVIPDLVVLLKYTCSKTNAGDDMRNILLDFVALKFRGYQYHPIFKEFLESSGKFSIELMQRIHEESENAIGLLDEYRKDYYKTLSTDEEDDNDEDEDMGCE
ncbi:hypothetical protein F5X99DRAFT_407560 [Biscogniauxia marginata]|nr:hypothetical protein F5X99DRAFT_407560 [Biscogniauxia marginata]